MDEDLLNAACEAFDDVYEAEYRLSGRATDNKRTAIAAAIAAACDEYRKRLDSALIEACFWKANWTDAYRLRNQIVAKEVRDGRL